MDKFSLLLGNALNCLAALLEVSTFQDIAKVQSCVLLACVCGRLWGCMFVCAGYMFVRVCMRACMCVCVHACVCVCVCAYVYACVRVCVHVV